MVPISDLIAYVCVRSFVRPTFGATLPRRRSPSSQVTMQLVSCFALLISYDAASPSSAPRGRSPRYSLSLVCPSPSFATIQLVPHLPLALVRPDAVNPSSAYRRRFLRYSLSLVCISLPFITILLTPSSAHRRRSL